MRKFYLQNQIGQRLDLNGPDGYFVNPRGLGVQASTDAADLGQGFFLSINPDEIPRDTPSGEMVFIRDQGYRSYRTFVDFLVRSPALTLIYAPDGSDEYFRDVTLAYIQKTELGSLKWLHCPISFAALTPWYKAVPKTFAFSMSEDDTPSKRYDYAYDYTYLEQLSAASVELTVQGHYPADVVLSYSGAIIDPVITLTGKQSGKIYGQCDLAVSTSSGDVLEYSSRRRDSYIRLRRSGAVSDLVPSADLTKNLFFHVPLEEPCILSIAADNQMTGQAQLALYEYYRGV